MLQVFHKDFVFIHVLLTPVIFFAPFRPSQSTQFTQSSQFTQFVQSSQFIQLLQSLHPLQSLQSLQPSQLLQPWHPQEAFSSLVTVEVQQPSPQLADDAATFVAFVSDMLYFFYISSSVWVRIYTYFLRFFCSFSVRSATCTPSGCVC